MSELLHIFKALGEPVRLGIVAHLLGRSEGQACGRELSEFLGVPAYQVSRHLKVLTAAGLVRSHRDGRRMYYELASGHGQEAQALRALIRAATATTGMIG